MKGNTNRNTSKETKKVYVYNLSKNKDKRPMGGRDVSAVQ